MNWEAIIRHYKAKHYPNHVAEMGWYRGQPSLRHAIGVAALAEDGRQKRFHHQRRLKRVALDKAKINLVRAEAKIENCRTFDELLTLLEELLVGVSGLGELYRYDTALRIGSWLGIQPDRVYLHAGTRVGATMLGIPRGLRSVENDRFPEPVRQLPATEIEDILCIYKGRIAHGS